MTEHPQDPYNLRNRDLRRLSRIVEDLFVIDAASEQAGKIGLALRPRYERARSLTLLRDRLTAAGYDYTVKESEEIVTVQTSARPRLRIPPLNIVLFASTFASVYLIPVFFRSTGWGDFQHNLQQGMGLEFAVALISILLVHEMGHFVASRRRGVVTSWPFFIPAPTIFGTFGALIKSKSPIRNRRDLIEVGASGPIFGWIVALGWLIYGLSHSFVAPVESAGFSTLALSIRGESLLMRALLLWQVGPTGPQDIYVLSEAAFAGWAGLLVTALNMLPIGQLDGGHIVYGLFPRIQRRLAFMAIVFLIFLGFQSVMWWLFAVLGFVMGPAHPPTIEDHRAPNLQARLLGVAALIILVLSFTPVPLAAPFEW